MKNSFGNSVILTVFGESHGEMIGAVIDGLAPGIKIDKSFIDYQLKLRRPYGDISTKRVENDEYAIVSGLFNDYTTGTPLCIMIKNQNVQSKDYEKNRYLATPSGCNYTAYCKYHGYEDYRGNGHFSGRITAAIVAAGAILLTALKNKNIKIATHIKQCRNIKDADFSADYNQLEKEIDYLNQQQFATINEKTAQDIYNEIIKAKERKDSVAGLLETAVIGVPAGLGEPFFSSVESQMAQAMFSVPAVKGIQFGKGFDYVNYYGSEVSDKFYIDENNTVKTYANNNGGINGGITNGMPIVFSTIIKPTSSIGLVQQTINFKEKTASQLQINGRHDPAIFHRARVVVDSMAALVMCDLLTSCYGNDYFRGE
ncbi:MAG: chorismate synthase [Erysipelotrichia bacterium]|nr:chorismate synthase [Erysipelotrichia bacterium]